MINEKDVCEIKKYVKQFKIQSIAFDLDGVLLETDHHEAEKQLSFSEKCIMAKHTISHASKPSKKWLFETLTKICNNDSLFLFHDNVNDQSKYQAYNEGLKLPPVMCLWQAGVYTSQEALQITLNDIEIAHRQKHIGSNEEKVLKIISRLTYDIESFTHTRKLTKVAQSLLDIVDDKTKIALITNYDVGQFEKSFNKFGQVLGAIPKENILVSAKEKLVKPNIEFYKLMIERCKFDSETTLFIDDEKHNVEAAIKAGIRFAYLPGFGLVCQ